MERCEEGKKFITIIVLLCLISPGCTVKAVGDPNRPITINAHITIDIKGSEKTANNIEDYVSGSKTSEDLSNSMKGEKKWKPENIFWSHW